MNYRNIIIITICAYLYAGPAFEVTTIKGKTALVTGGSQGLGLAIAKDLAKEGVSKLAICARNIEKVNKAKEALAIEFPNVKVYGFRCDISDKSSRNLLVKELFSAFNNKLDILINNAGVEKCYHYEKYTEEDIEMQMQINNNGAAQLTRAFMPQMIERKTGHIVMMSSILGQLPCAYCAIYSATRHFTYGLAMSLRGEMAHRQTGVTVHSIHPGFIENTGVYKNVQDDVKKDTSAQEFHIHWLFGTGGQDVDTAIAVSKMIKTNQPEVIINTPPLRPTIVLSKIFPRFFDYLVYYWPGTVDPLADAIKLRVNGKLKRDTLAVSSV